VTARWSRSVECDSSRGGANALIAWFRLTVACRRFVGDVPSGECQRGIIRAPVVCHVFREGLYRRNAEWLSRLTWAPFNVIRVTVVLPHPRDVLSATDLANQVWEMVGGLRHEHTEKNRPRGCV